MAIRVQIDGFTYESDDAKEALSLGAAAKRGDAAPRKKERRLRGPHIRNLIYALYRERGGPFDGWSICNAIMETNAAVRRASVENEIYRMKKDGFLVVAGSNGKANLYALAKLLPPDSTLES